MSDQIKAELRRQIARASSLREFAFSKQNREAYHATLYAIKLLKRLLAQKPVRGA